MADLERLAVSNALKLPLAFHFFTRSTMNSFTAPPSISPTLPPIITQQYSSNGSVSIRFVFDLLDIFNQFMNNGVCFNNINRVIRIIISRVGKSHYNCSCLNIHLCILLYCYILCFISYHKIIGGKN